ncbi:MAG: PEP-CTERM sorting domain-containing protein [Planctomycetota bacterium]
MIRRCTTLLLALLLVAPSLYAGPIDWAAVVPDTGAGDLIGGPVISFVGAPFPQNTAEGTFFTGDGGDTGNTELNLVYDSHGWFGGSPAFGTVTLAGLTDGTQYQIQLLGAGDTRGCCSTRTQTASDELGNVSGEFMRGNSSVIGTFTATGDSQDIILEGATDPGLSGYILTDGAGALVEAVNYTPNGTNVTVTVPEPGSLILALMAFAAIFGNAGRRQRS